MHYNLFIDPHVIRKRLRYADYYQIISKRQTDVSEKEDNTPCSDLEKAFLIFFCVSQLEAVLKT